MLKWTRPHNLRKWIFCHNIQKCSRIHKVFVPLFDHSCIKILIVNLMRPNPFLHFEIIKNSIQASNFILQFGDFLVLTWKRTWLDRKCSGIHKVFLALFTHSCKKFDSAIIKCPNLIYNSEVSLFEMVSPESDLSIQL